MLPAGMPNQKDSHTWAKEGWFTPGWCCCQTGCTAYAVKRYVACTVLEKRQNGFCWLIWEGKSRLLGMGWTNLKEEFQQQPRVASSEKVAWANLWCADSVFSTELNPSNPCEEFAFGDHILYGSCLLSSGWGKPLVYSLRWKVCWLEEFFFMFEKI